MNQELLDFIQGKRAVKHWGLAASGKGINTFPGRGDENQESLHEQCLEFEKLGLVYRHYETPDMIVWMPKE